MEIPSKLGCACPSFWVFGKNTAIEWGCLCWINLRQSPVWWFSKKLFLAHSIPHQATNGGVIDNTETDQQALAPQRKYYCFASNEALFAAMKLYKQLHCQLCCLVKFWIEYWKYQNIKMNFQNVSATELFAALYKQLHCQLCGEECGSTMTSANTHER